MKAAWTLALLPFAVALAAGQGSAQSDAGPDLSDQQRQLTEARAQSAAAADRAQKLEAAAAAEKDEAAKAKAQEQALAAKVQQAQADILAATARIALVDRLLDQQQGQLAQQQGPIAKLVGALCSLARRPGMVNVVQPGSLADLVHVRAVLATTLIRVQERTAGLRAELDLSRKLRRDAALAANSLTEGRRALEANRVALASAEADHRLKSLGLTRSALTESDKAIGLGERARDIADGMEVSTDAAATGAALAKLDGPLPRPAQPGEIAPLALSWTMATAPYRLPVGGTLVTGFGEVSEGGVTSRGLTFAVAANAAVIAPAAGKILYAGAFRDYGQVVIIDHGGGWATLIAGMGNLAVRQGQIVRQGTALGAAGGGTPRVTVELRRKGRPVDLVALTG